MSVNLNNLALELSGTKTISFAFYQQKASLTGRFQGHVQKDLQECTSTVLVSPDPLCPTPAVSSGMKL